MSSPVGPCGGRVGQTSQGDLAKLQGMSPGPESRVRAPEKGSTWGLGLLAGAAQAAGQAVGGGSRQGGGTADEKPLVKTIANPEAEYS